MKQEMRRVLLTQRQELTPEMRARQDAALRRRLRDWIEHNPVHCLGVYWPIRGEPDLRELYGELAQRGVRLALPIVVAPDAPLSFSAWTPGDAMETGAMKVPIPAAPRRTLAPEALLIPCVGFNRDRVRIGYGGGFYDRTLAQTPHPIAIGIAYHQALSAFAADPHDIALDIVLTDEAEIS